MNGYLCDLLVPVYKYVVNVMIESCDLSKLQKIKCVKIQYFILDDIYMLMYVDEHLKNLEKRVIVLFTQYA